jgi:hypothetical protein
LHTFCVYSASDEARIREHAAAFGGHSIDWISVIAARWTPRRSRFRLLRVAFPAHREGIHRRHDDTDRQVRKGEVMKRSVRWALVSVGLAGVVTAMTVAPAERHRRRG